MHYNEIQKKFYYRLAKVFFWIVMLLSFAVAFGVKKNQFISALNLVSINALILFIIWKITLYVIYGKIDYSPAQKIDNSWYWGVLFSVLFITFLISASV